MWPMHFNYADREGVCNSRHGKHGKVGTVMSEYKHGELHSGSKSGPKVTDRDQAVAIAMSEAGRSRKKKGKR